MEVITRACLSRDKLWRMDFNTGYQQGQWRNDVFSERGAVVNCSGDICDGLWINGYPAEMKQKAECGSGRSHNSKTLQGHCVLVVHEVTMPPFLDQTPTSAFRLSYLSRENRNQEQRFFHSHQSFLNSVLSRGFWRP
ncbi:hypothetical protein AV530_011236 [Patagioenas fasciata monilis]|uniref:Uncharacterized protein n=1 Tax=Patagioenas fasciata monilis TaxID=372326 RepID=A0A1V4KQJ0_PATFA|nr:hypothetical protein AV530_011236 [Patagioenas fasciata monilis]